MHKADIDEFEAALDAVMTDMIRLNELVASSDSADLWEIGKSVSCIAAALKGCRLRATRILLEEAPRSMCGNA